jgi:hypothetical protein
VSLIVGYVSRPKYVLEGEPHGFPNASYSEARFCSERLGPLSELAISVMLAYNQKCAAKSRKKKPVNIDWKALEEKLNGTY